MEVGDFGGFVVGFRNEGGLIRCLVVRFGRGLGVV